MESTEIILIAVAFAVVGLRIYQKYFRKSDKTTVPGTTKPGMPESKEDEYEPYSKR